MDTKKGVNHPMLILNLWLPPSDHATKQARTAHARRREPSRLLALIHEYFAGIRKRERQEQKALISLKSTERDERNNFRFWLIIVVSIAVLEVRHFGAAVFLIIQYCLFRVLSFFDC